MRIDTRVPVPISAEISRATRSLETKQFDQAAKKEKVEHMAQEFEALLLEKMIHGMRAGVPESGLFGEKKSEKIFEEMLDGEYARLMARKGGIGIQKYLVEQMAKRDID